MISSEDITTGKNLFKVVVSFYLLTISGLIQLGLVVEDSPPPPLKQKARENRLLVTAYMKTILVFLTLEAS